MLGFEHGRDKNRRGTRHHLKGNTVTSRCRLGSGSKRDGGGGSGGVMGLKTRGDAVTLMKPSHK